VVLLITILAITGKDCAPVIDGTRIGVGVITGVDC
jgi:hypothetical protein